MPALVSIWAASFARNPIGSYPFFEDRISSKMECSKMVNCLVRIVQVDFRVMKWFRQPTVIRPLIDYPIFLGYHWIFVNPLTHPIRPPNNLECRGNSRLLLRYTYAHFLL